MLAVLMTKVAGEFNIEPADYVNIQGGTESREDLSHGGTLPFITRPWAFTNWAPLTDTGSWWFTPGIRCYAMLTSDAKLHAYEIMYHFN